jgi:hypothetical protein
MVRELHTAAKKKFRHGSMTIHLFNLQYQEFKFSWACIFLCKQKTNNYMSAGKYLFLDNDAL